MTDIKACMSSKTDLWETPQELFDHYDKIFHFQTDVCALPQNAKCKHYFTPQEDGLKQNWTGVCWMNPPYGNPEYPCRANCKKKKCKDRGCCNHKYKPGIIDWVKKAYESSLGGATIVCLLPSRTDTEWWHEYVMKGEIEFKKGRVRFIDEDGNTKMPAPFPSAIVIFRPEGGKENGTMAAQTDAVPSTRNKNNQITAADHGMV